MVRNPAKSRPLSTNVKRMMWLERAEPRNQNVLNAERIWNENDYIYCHKQGQLFMEAAAMGFSMESFVPLYMTSHLAGVIDYRQHRTVAKSKKKRYNRKYGKTNETGRNK